MSSSEDDGKEMRQRQAMREQLLKLKGFKMDVVRSELGGGEGNLGHVAHAAQRPWDTTSGVIHLNLNTGGDHEKLSHGHTAVGSHVHTTDGGGMRGVAFIDPPGGFLGPPCRPAGRPPRVSICSLVVQAESSPAAGATGTGTAGGWVIASVKLWRNTACFQNRTSTDVRAE